MRARILKILAVVAFGMVTLPLMLANDVIAFGGFSLLRFAAYYAAFGLLFALGYALTSASKKRKKLLILSRAVGILCFFLSFLPAIFTEAIGLIVTVGFCAAFWYFLGERAAVKHYADFFPAFALVVYIVVTLGAYISCGMISDEKFGKAVGSAIIVMFAIELAMSAMLINQSGIYDKANRRSEIRTMLPKGLSGYNAALVLIIVSAGLGLYFFKDYIIDFLTAIVRLIAQLVIYLMRMNSDSMAIQDAEEGMAPLFSADGMPLNRLTMTLFVVIAVVLAIIYRKKIWQALKDFAKRIREFFTREQPESGEDTGFVDFFEELPAARRKNDVINDSKLLRLYRAERDPREKYRLGYRIILRELNKNMAKIIPPDTVNEQLEKGKAVCGGSFGEITRVYSALRYDDETVTAEQLAALEEFRKICSK